MDRQNEQDGLKGLRQDGKVKSLVPVFCFIIYPVHPVDPCKKMLARREWQA